MPIKCAHIVPPAYLTPMTDILHEHDFHLVLAHLVDRDDEYAKFYRGLSAGGATIVMDNSAYELGHSYPAEKLLELAVKVGADELMLPEVFGDAGETERQALEFLDDMTPAGGAPREDLPDGLKFFGTLCGNTFEAIRQLYEAFILDGRIATIGFSYRQVLEDFFTPEFPTETWTRMMRRVLLISKFNAEVGLEPRINHHLMGITNPLELFLLKRLPVGDLIRSCDSSTAFVHGLNDILFDPTMGLEDRAGNCDFEMTNPLDAKQYSAILRNMTVMEAFARGEVIQ